MTAAIALHWRAILVSMKTNADLKKGGIDARYRIEGND